MENTLFFKIEIITFFLTLGYVLYYISEKIILTYGNIKKIIKPDRKIVEDKVKKIQNIINNKRNNQKDITKNISKVSVQDNKKIKELIKRVNINTTKGYYDTAKSLIIEGLSIDKYNKELNIELANIYEIDKDYSKAEFIYKDLLEKQEDTFIILKKIGYNLALQNKLEDSLGFFIEAFNKKKNDIDTIETISDLMYELKYYKKAIKYIKLFLKENPRNTEKMKMKAYCYEVLGKNDDALLVYNKILDLQPYNSQIIERVKHIEGL